MEDYRIYINKKKIDCSISCEKQFGVNKGGTSKIMEYHSALQREEILTRYNVDEPWGHSSA